ncbi:hypothetical protein LCGC14_1812740 [marine sediment metagenome]|uniref:Transcription factor zinc-finger domain-containing protein n=1 Tax=marine sediment metagenome TaxID=412755 RepID=A0A0F9J0Z0_9ZZZZ
MDTFKIENPKYKCPKCGIVEENLQSTMVNLEGDWCLRCYMKWVSKNVPKLEKIDNPNP